MAAQPSNAEITVRVIAGLIDLSERRAAIVAPLADLIRQAVDELDPDHVRDSRPTWLADLPRWARLDAFDRLRKATDDLRLLEVQAEEVIQDLRASFTVPNPAHRALGLTPARAYEMLVRMAERRAELVTTMARSEKSLRPRLTKPTSAALRRALRRLGASETDAAGQRAALGFLLLARQVGPSQPSGISA